MTVLVVDDNPVNRELAQAYLRILGYDSLTASDGFQALEIYGCHSLRAILVDLHMPQMNGIEVVRSIRCIEKQEGKGRVAVIAWTASSGTGSDAECLAAGMDAILSKPIDLCDLRRVLSRFVHLDSR